MADMKVIPFMAHRKIAAVISGLVLLGCTVSLTLNGLQFGLDFTGGTQLEIGFERPVDLVQVRSTLDQQSLRNYSVVHFGTDVDVLIRMQGALKDIGVQQVADRLQELGIDTRVALDSRGINTDQYAERLLIGAAPGLAENLQQVFPVAQYGSIYSEAADDGGLYVFLKTSIDEIVTREIIAALGQAVQQQAELRRSEFVGPQVGEELRDDGGLGLLFALAVVMVYVAMRFQLKFSIGAVAALAHDVIFVVGVFSLMHFDFDLTVLAAVLAVIGYSLNDTIVVSDRIRENFRKVRKSTPQEIIDISLTQTLGRTLVTSLTTLLVLTALFLVGGELIRGFSTALIIGVIVGTYSSVYVVPNVLLAMNISKEDLMLPEKEGAELEEV